MTSSTTPLAALRALVPRRSVSFDEALQIAEQQARRLVDFIADIDGVRELHIADMPRISVVREEIPVSGLSYWNGRTWVIALSKTDSHVRQRFTLLHEFKHIVDHGRSDSLYVGDRRRDAQHQAELAADYFAGCALVDKRHLKAAWGNGIQRLDDLAAHFSVSQHAMRVRLSQTGLSAITDETPLAARCARPISSHQYTSQRFRRAAIHAPRRNYA